MRVNIDTKGGAHLQFPLLTLGMEPCKDIGVNMHRNNFLFSWTPEFGASEERVIEWRDIRRVNRIVRQCINVFPVRFGWPVHIGHVHGIAPFIA